MKRLFYIALSVLLFLTTSCTVNEDAPEIQGSGFEDVQNSDIPVQHTDNRYLYPAFSNETDRWGYIDSLGKWIIAPEYEKVLSPHTLVVWSELEVVPVFDGNSWGYMNSRSEWVIAPEYVYVYGAFYGGFTLAKPKEKENVYIFFNKLGEVVDFPTSAPCLNFSTSDDLYMAFEGTDAMYGYKDWNGSWIISPDYYYADPSGYGVIVDRNFSEGLAKFYDRETERYGYINTSGNVIITPQFMAANPFSESKAVVYMKLVASYIDTNGELLTDYKFESAKDFSNGLAPATLDDFIWGYIDESFEWFIEPCFDNAYSFVNGVAYVEYIDDTKGYINTKNESIFTWV